MYHREAVERLRIAEDAVRATTNHFLRHREWLTPIPPREGGEGADNVSKKRKRGNQALTLTEYHEALKLAEYWQVANEAEGTTKKAYCDRLYHSESSQKLKRLDTGLHRMRELVEEWKLQGSPPCREFIETKHKGDQDATPDLLADLAKRLEYAARRDADKHA